MSQSEITQHGVLSLGAWIDTLDPWALANLCDALAPRIADYDCGTGLGDVAQGIRDDAETPRQRYERERDARCAWGMAR